MVVSAPRDEVKLVLHCIVRMSKTTNHAFFCMHLAAQTGHGVSEFRVHTKSQERMGQTEARDATPTSDHGSSLKPQSVHTDLAACLSMSLVVKALALFRSGWLVIPSQRCDMPCTITPSWPVAVPHALVDTPMSLIKIDFEPW